MGARPEAGMKLKGESRDVAFRILRRFGYRQAVRRSIVLIVGWLVFATGIGLFIHAILSPTADSSWQIASIGVMFAVCAAGLGLVAIGRRKSWVVGPTGKVLRFDGGRRLVVSDDIDGRTLGEWTLPSLPPQESLRVLSPEAYAGMVRDLSALLATATGDDPLGSLPPENAGAIRGWVLLGELAARLRGLGHTDWMRGALFPRPIRIGVFGGLLATLALCLLHTAGAAYYTLTYALLSACSLAGHRAWGRGLRCGPLHISDRLDDGAFVVTIRGPGGVVEERLAPVEVLYADLEVRDPTPLDELAASAVALIEGHSSRMVTDSPGRASALPR